MPAKVAAFIQGEINFLFWVHPLTNSSNLKFQGTGIWEILYNLLIVLEQFQASILRVILDDGPRSKISRTNLRIFETNWILELDLSSQNFFFFFGKVQWVPLGSNLRVPLVKMRESHMRGLNWHFFAPLHFSHVFFYPLLVKHTMDDHQHKILVVLILTMPMHQVIVFFLFFFSPFLACFAF
jgi:hypothetical protein